MPLNSNQKGKAGEREAAAFLREHGFDARRGQQFAGGGDSPDVVHSVPYTHIEVKRVEALSLYKALEQSIEDAPEVEDDAYMYPVVMHRRNNKPWVVIMLAEDFLEIMHTVGDYQ